MFNVLPLSFVQDNGNKSSDTSMPLSKDRLSLDVILMEGPINVIMRKWQQPKSRHEHIDTLFFHIIQKPNIIISSKTITMTHETIESFIDAIVPLH